MKKILFFSILLALFAQVSAAPVERTTAKKIAVNFLESIGFNTSNAIIEDITGLTPFSEFYLLSINGNGFIIVSGDDNTEPILGYSLKGGLNATQIPANMVSWLNGYEEAIRYNRATPSQNKSAKQQWQLLISGKSLPEETKASVDPMITTTWNQSPYYNAFCPYDSANNGLAVSGCTATATAQIMNHFAHPATGYGSCSYTHPRLGLLSADYGSTTYQWDSMPAELNDYSSAAQIEAVATLIYHIGVSVSMDYSALGSGGKTASYGYGGEPSSENALKYNFKYSPYIWTAFQIDYTASEWKNLMKNELNNGRPILYAGYDKRQAGHAFVLDGYNNLGFFHINWGWGGTADGYFKITELNPSPNGVSYYNFNYFSTATIGIEPYEGFNTNGTTTVTVAASGNDGASGSVSGGGTYQFGDTITLTATAADGTMRFVKWSDGCRYNPRSTVATGGDISFTAIFAPVSGDVMRYHTCDNAMNRASNLPYGLGQDSIWGVKFDAGALRPHHDLKAVKFMGRKAGNHTLTVFAGTDSPSQVLYTATFFDTLDYAYSWYTHTLSSPVDIDDSESLWIVLKCTDVDTPGVFSIYGGNPNGILSGESLTPMDSQWKFSWMIEGLFEWDGTEGIYQAESQEFNFTIYPNPSDGQISISLDNPSENISLHLFDINGREIFSLDKLPDATAALPITLPSGIYQVQLISPSGIASRKLVVK